MRQTWSVGVRLLVVDDYKFDAKFERAARPWADKVLVIDDLANRSHDADLLVDRSSGSVQQRYEELVPTACEVLCGSSYALIRTSAIARRKHSATVERILGTFAAMDCSNVTMLASRALSAVRIDCAVDVVLGAGATYRMEVEEFVAGFQGQVQLHVEVKDMSVSMSNADMAFGAVGATVWEFCALELPSLLLTVADNQKANATALSQAGAARVVGSLEDVSLESLTTAVLAMTESASDRKRMSEAAATICDGQGASRVADVVEDKTTCPASGHNVQQGRRRWLM